MDVGPFTYMGLGREKVFKEKLVYNISNPLTIALGLSPWDDCKNHIYYVQYKHCATNLCVNDTNLTFNFDL